MEHSFHHDASIFLCVGARLLVHCNMYLLSRHLYLLVIRILFFFLLSYALYDEYGYSQHLIAVLFVAGFGSSMVFGSFIGGMADACGRRKFVILFAVIYALSCVTKHFRNFHILMLGRLLGGVATSLLFSVFDSWLIRAHADAGIKSYLSKSFSAAAYGNSLVAIGAGLVANKAANSNKLLPFFGDKSKDLFYTGGYLNPFDIALVALVLCGFLAATQWEENYGDSTTDNKNESNDGRGKELPWYGALKNAYTTTVRSRDIFLCGVVSSFFEGSMYIFVFMWTPALKGLTPTEEGEDSPSLPFGLIFSTFMVCCMVGSSLFSILVERIKVEILGIGVLFVSAVSMMAIVFSTSDTVTFIFMNTFEMCVGMYWPIMGTMKGSIVPEDKRAAIYNLFRIPLNFIVLTSLLTDLTPKQSFMANTGMLALGAACQVNLMKRRLNVRNMDDLKGKAMQEEEKGGEDETVELTKGPDPPAESQASTSDDV